MKKLLFDENISQRVIARISSIYSGAAHVNCFGGTHLNLFFCEWEIAQHLILFKY